MIPAAELFSRMLMDAAMLQAEVIEFEPEMGVDNDTLFHDLQMERDGVFLSMIHYVNTHGQEIVDAIREERSSRFAKTQNVQDHPFFKAINGIT
jgi:hypothetical protein